jgi:hypothetical protein
MITIITLILALNINLPVESTAIVKPVPPLFTFVWQNKYDTNHPNEITQVLDITDMKHIRVFAETQTGMFTVMRTNAYKIFKLRNYDPDTGLYDITYE